MKLMAIALLFFGCSAFAQLNGYEAKLRININGKISEELLRAPQGQKTTISRYDGIETNLIDVTISESTNPTIRGILLDFSFATIQPNGHRVDGARLKMITQEGAPAMITSEEENGTKISVSSIVERISL